MVCRPAAVAGQLLALLWAIISANMVPKFGLMVCAMIQTTSTTT